MAFDWLGTFNRSLLERFIDFARSQTCLVDDRIAHLEAEIQRVGTLDFAYENGIPSGYSVAKPADSYVAKLVGAYEVLGGDALYDLNVRSMAQPIFVIKADEASPAQRLSSGEILSQPGLNDARSGELVRQAKTWLHGTLKYRKEYLERKIRRALDYVDQLQAEVKLLNVVQAEAQVLGSLDFVVTEIMGLMQDRSYQAVYDDKGADSHGLKVMAPLAAYPGGPSRPDIVSDQRTFDGFESATDKGSA